MANRDAYDVMSPRSEVQLVTLVLAGAGAAALVPSDPGGIEFDIVDVTRTGVGTHDIVLKHPYAQLLNVIAGSHGATPGLHARVEEIDVVAKTLTVVCETFGDGTAAAWQTGVAVTTHVATLSDPGIVTSVAATTETGLFPAWSGATAVTANSAALSTAGMITAVELVAGGVTGAGNLRDSAAANSRDVRVVYDAAGVPTLSFLAGDAVTSCKYQQVTKGVLQKVKEIIHTGTPGPGQVKVEYAAGVPTLTFNTADNVTVAAVAQFPGDAAASAVDAATDDSIYLTLVVRNSKHN